jgi:RimJ/RimL family protein N-acetyltransferase
MLAEAQLRVRRFMLVCRLRPRQVLLTAATAVIAGVVLEQVFHTGAATVIAVVAGELWMVWALGQPFPFEPPASFFEGISPGASARLVVRPLATADIDRLVATIDRDVIDANGWVDAGQWDYLRAQRHARTSGQLVICERSTNEVLGATAVAELDWTSRSAEFGWWMGPKGRGRGLSTEAVGLALMIYHRAGLSTLRIGTSVDNAAVLAVVERLGARFIEERPHTLPNGAVLPSLWFEHTA